MAKLYFEPPEYAIRGMCQDFAISNFYMRLRWPPIG